MKLRALDTSQLMDMLAKYTIDYTKMLTDGSSQEEYLKCKEAIKAIQSEIELRQNGGTDSPTSNSSSTS
jgi:hypothetical protein